MSTSVRSLSCSLVGNSKVNRCGVLLKPPFNPQPEAFKGLQLTLHFWEWNPFSYGSGSDYTQLPPQLVGFQDVEDPISAGSATATLCRRRTPAEHRKA